MPKRGRQDFTRHLERTVFRGTAARPERTVDGIVLF